MDTVAPTTWPEFIRHRRTNLGLLQTDLAELVGCHQGDISRWERGSYLPPSKMIGRLVSALQITPEELHALTTGEPTEVPA